MMKTSPDSKDPISAPSTPDINVQSIATRIKPLSAMGGPLSCLFYGRSGTGKTTLAGTFPTPILLLDVSEKGTDSLEGVPGIDVLLVKCWEDFETIYWFLRGGNHPYKTVVVDTVTQLQKLAIEYILEQDGKEKTGQMNRNLWGQSAKLLTAWFINYRDLPLNTVFLAQDRNTTEENAAGEDQIIQEVGPRLSPSVAASLNAAVKVIGQTYIKEYIKSTKDGNEKIYSYRLRIGPHSLYLTKVRKAKTLQIPSSIHDPSYAKLMKAITGTQEPQAKEEDKEE